MERKESVTLTRLEVGKGGIGKEKERWEGLGSGKGSGN